VERSEVGTPGLHPVPGGEDETANASRLWDLFLESSDRGPFLESWAQLLFTRLGARRGLVLLGPPDRGPFAPAVTWPSDASPGRQLGAATERVLRERRGGVGAPEARSGQEPRTLEGGTLAHPILVSGRLHGAVVAEVPLRPRAELEAQLRELVWGCGWLESLLRGEQASQSRTGQSRLETVLNLVSSALEQGRFQGAVTAFATEMATRFGCDRVSIGFVRNGRVQIRGISHSAHFQRKTNLVRDIEAAMEEALDQQATVVVPPLSGELPRAARSHEELARRHGAANLCSVPFAWEDEICGVLTVERSEAHPFDAATLEECEAAASLGGPVLEVRRREDRWLGVKALEAARRQLGHLLGPHHVALKLGALAVAGLLLFLYYAHGDFRVTADAILEPAELRAAVAPFGGYIARAPVRAGDLVQKGDLLASLDDRELRLERLKWASQHEQLSRQYREALAARDAAEVEILAASIAQARAELDLIEDRLAQTEVRAPFDGVVVSGDLSQRLGAPTEIGDVLFEVAPLDGYRVIVQVDERDVAYLRPEQRGQLVLSSLPDANFPIVVEKLTPVSAAEEGRNRFRVEAHLDETHPRLRPGMEGVGKIEIEERRLVWIWTHEAVDWLRLALWKWLP